jgi:hypothetical protein
MKTHAVILLWPLPWGGVGGGSSTVAQRVSAPLAHSARYHRVERSYFENIAQALR